VLSSVSLKVLPKEVSWEAAGILHRWSLHPKSFPGMTPLASGVSWTPLRWMKLASAVLHRAHSWALISSRFAASI